MATGLISTQWTEILQYNRLTKKIDIDIFQTLYAFEGHKTNAGQIGRILGTFNF